MDTHITLKETIKCILIPTLLGNSILTGFSATLKLFSFCRKTAQALRFSVQDDTGIV